MHFCQSRITMVVPQGRLGAAGGQRGEVWGPPRSCLTLPQHLTRLSFHIFCLFSSLLHKHKTGHAHSEEATIPAQPCPEGQPELEPKFSHRRHSDFSTGQAGGRTPLAQVSRAVSCQAATSRAESTEPAQSMAPQQAKPKQSQQSLPGEARACQIPWGTGHPAHGAGSQQAQGAQRSQSFTAEYIPG